jgi:hypothetical protein
MSSKQGPINLGIVVSVHAKFKRAHTELLAKETRRAGEFGLQHVGRHPKFKPRTGQLQRATEYKVVKLRSGAKITLLNPKPYAAAIDKGASPHVIRPRRARALRFIARGGSVVFAQKVNHPGNKPYKFLYRATVAAGRVFEQSMQHGMDQIGKTF